MFIPESRPIGLERWDERPELRASYIPQVHFRYHWQLDMGAPEIEENNKNLP